MKIRIVSLFAIQLFAAALIYFGIAGARTPDPVFLTVVQILPFFILVLGIPSHKHRHAFFFCGFAGVFISTLVFERYVNTFIHKPSGFKTGESIGLGFGLMALSVAVFFWLIFSSYVSGGLRVKGNKVHQRIE